MVGGGVHGKVAGIAHVIMTGAGFITAVFRVFITTYPPDGEDTTETVIGTDTDGTMNEFLTTGFIRTGRAGIITDIGRSKEAGALSAINPDRKERDRN